MDFGWAAEPSVRARARALSKCSAGKILAQHFYFCCHLELHKKPPRYRLYQFHSVPLLVMGNVVLRLEQFSAFSFSHTGLFADVIPPDSNKLNPPLFLRERGRKKSTERWSRRRGGGGAEGKGRQVTARGKGCREAKIELRNVVRLKRKKVRHGGKGWGSWQAVKEFWEGI